MNYNTNHTQPMLDNYLQSALIANQTNCWRFNPKRALDFSLATNGPPPPPEYDLNSGGSTSTTPDSKSNEKLSSLSSLSRSHQDLSRLDEDLNTALKNGLQLSTRRYPLNYQSLINSGSPNVQHNMIEILSAENASLKNELENYSRKVSKLQKFELEIQKVHQAHEELIKSSEKKEKLERAVRYKLEIELMRLQEQNKNLKDQMNSALASMAVTKRSLDVFSDDNELKNEVQKRDVLIAQLLSQNKELLTEKERQEIELQAQRLTLEEQRNHIEILDNALMNAQNNVVKLEADLRKKAAYEERANHLQKALGNLQLASERRLQMEKRVRNHLEKEIECLKKQLNGCVMMSDEKKEIETLRKALVEYEEKIIALESEVTKWESKYFEENTMRHIELNAASAPKDAKIAALEKTSEQSEKLILEARNERLKQMDELHGAQKKVAQLESKIKDMESKLAEKEAMIKVLQQHSRDKDVVLQKSLLAHRAGPSSRHARSASSMGLTTSSCNPSQTNPMNVSATSSVSEEKEQNCKENGEIFSTNSCCGVKSKTFNNHNSNESDHLALSNLSNNSNNISNTNTSTIATTAANINTTTTNSNNNNNNNNNLDEQLKELDIRLTSKDSIIRALRSEKERYPNHFWNV